ncbi:hypothetical protein [Pelosinus baikalensis]|uniref:Uncharacterized protein n=1 Tax=Pelosinus baikalensis TaxID=2892015 RepID=A0ABS8HWX4_9FIRM|nr:hypothetical protein [Pelosinus baikalensis]MCC5467659.1 hypothetical protein [Pelosinus baikalensis]
MSNLQKFFHVSVIPLSTNDFISKYSNLTIWFKVFKHMQYLLLDLDNCKDKSQVDSLITKSMNALDFFLKYEKINFNQPLPEVFTFYMREVIAEKVRSDYFPHRPNRQESIFVVDNIQSAIDFNEKCHEGSAIIYECMPTKPSVLFKADMDLINHSYVDKVNPLSFKENMFTYWEAKEPIKIQEILCPCPVVVLRPYSFELY